MKGTGPWGGRGRREFLKSLAGGVLSWAPMAAAGLGKARPGENPAGKSGMLYRRLGRTGLRVSEISLGSSPLPDPSLLRALIDRGVNYIDTSHNYENGNSERLIGRLLKEAGRDKLHVGTKFHVRPQDTTESIVASVHGSIRRLATDFIDVLLIHGADSADVLVDDRVLGAFERLKRQGICRFRGLSCHENHGQVVRKAVDCGFYDMVQIGYNVFDIQESEQPPRTYPDYLGESGIRGLLELAKTADVGVIAMKTLKVGGRRQSLDPLEGPDSLYRAMLRWVLADPRVSSALTEILTHEQMEEDLGAAGAPLSAAEKTLLARHVRDHGRDYCHMCGSCRRACPSGIPTTGILRSLAYLESYGNARKAKASYDSLGTGGWSGRCLDCGSCEKACPYGVSVRKRIREAHRSLA